MAVSSKETWIMPGAGYAHQTYELSHADHFPGPIYPQRYFLYKNHAGKPDFLPTDRLVAGLKTVLDHYPMLYGRLALRDDGEYEVRPSTEGVPFIETAAEEDFAAFEPDCPQHCISPNLQAITQPPSEHTPLLGIKLTRFASNSGVAICFSCSHYVADGYACLSFIKNWAAIVRGELKLPFPPADGRQLLRLDPKPSEEEQRQFFRQQQKQHQPDYQPGSNASVNKGVIIRFTTDKLQALKADAMASLSDAEKEAGWFSTMDAICMLVWRATIRARMVAKERPLTCMTAVTMRDKHPDLPKGYFGNGFNQSLLTATAGDIVDRPLGRMAAMHRQGILASRAHTMEQWLMQADMTSKTLLAERAANWLPFADYFITDWSKFGYYTVDFGEGRPAYCRRFFNPHKRVICILDMPPTLDGSPTGFDVCITVDETSYDRFCADNELLAYGTIIGQ
ncbi:transferase [Syncephalis pseudoplumigaleata]|uniref:Transferase n=2 Tax=Zoopagomycota TaxID=1913638 RepID=A0A4P9ZLU8_9FUNG|nr:transferase [Syncephalis pseudoplumigaleata]RKP34133.1 transferase [Dimargaris cristalligena]|eukprot:RKP27668.1 transferase [Syncephalis pseudoplumigaleata]